MNEELHVLNLGAGVQSTSLYLMAIDGELTLTPGRHRLRWDGGNARSITRLNPSKRKFANGLERRKGSGFLKANSPSNTSGFRLMSRFGFLA